jgi:hypothetical protein
MRVFLVRGIAVVVVRPVSPPFAVYTGRVLLISDRGGLAATRRRAMALLSQLEIGRVPPK